MALKVETLVRLKPQLVQILVVVANIQTRILKTEVEKGSMRTAVGHGLVDPKRQGCSAHSRLCLVSRKGVGLIFPNQDVDTVWQRKRIR